MYCHWRSIIELLKPIRISTNKQLGQPKREGERKRHTYSVDMCVGFKRVHFLYVLFVKLLKHTPLKPMHCHCRSIIESLKPIRNTTNKQLKSCKWDEKQLKPTCLAWNMARKPAAKQSHNFLRSAPALRRHVSHAHTASPRPPRTARTSRSRSRNQFPVQGGRTSRTSSP